MPQVRAPVLGANLGPIYGTSRYFAGAGCGAALGAEKFTLGTSRDPSLAAK